MRIRTEPEVEIVSAPVYLGDNEKFPLPDVEGFRDGGFDAGAHAIMLGSRAAKGCYDSFGEDGRACEANQRAILDHKHGSGLEHINIGLWIEGITRALSIELNRHRHFAISQRSTRYTDEEDPEIVLEPFYAEVFKDMGNPLRQFAPRNGEGNISDRDWKVWRALHSHLRAAKDDIAEYSVQVDRLMELTDKEGTEARKWARGKARNSLPHNLATCGTWTANIRSWRWILEARSNRHAADEIRRLTGEYIFPALKRVAPLYFEDFEVEMIDGLPELQPEHSKV